MIDKTVSLTDFITFVSKAGLPKQTVVKEIKTREAYDPRFDFWRCARQAIIQHHKLSQLGKLNTEAILETIEDRKKERYRAALTGYNRFLGRKSLEWFDPGKYSWEESNLTVRINPELGLLLNGKALYIKLYFKDESLTSSKRGLILDLMLEAIQPGPDENVALLDVEKGQLYPALRRFSSALPLLKGEAASFAQIWQYLPAPVTRI